MTRLAAGRNWQLATAEQQKVLTEEFRTLLVRTYFNVLAHYHDEVIEFKQLHTTPLDTEVTVRSEVKQPGKERMTLDYVMEKTPAGWKIYDVKVAGVCLITNYRDVFAETVDGGVDGLIQFLVDQNRWGNSKFNSIKTSFLGKVPGYVRSSRICFGVAHTKDHALAGVITASPAAGSLR